MISPKQQIKSFQEISDEFEFVVKIINKRLSQLHRTLSKDGKTKLIAKNYKYNTLAEINLLKLEIEKKYILELAAAFEAKLVFYFKYILESKHNLYLVYHNRVSDDVKSGKVHLMYHHILKVLKKEIDNIAFSNFEQLVHYRNWLAHGRGWELENHINKFDFQYTLDTINCIIDYMPDFPDLIT